jgi:hypothetical protein
LFLWFVVTTTGLLDGPADPNPPAEDEEDDE